METTERNSDSIDKLTSLVSKMNVKMDRREAPYKPRFTKVALEAKVEIDNKLSSPVIDPSVGIGIEIGATTTAEIIIGHTIWIGPGTPTDVTIEEITIGLTTCRVITGKTIEETVIDKTIEETTEIDKIIEEMTSNRGIGIGVQVERYQEITVVTILEVEIEINGHRQQRARTLSDDRDRSRSRSRSNL